VSNSSPRHSTQPPCHQPTSFPCASRAARQLIKSFDALNQRVPPLARALLIAPSPFVPLFVVVRPRIVAVFPIHQINSSNTNTQQNGEFGNIIRVVGIMRCVALRGVVWRVRSVCGVCAVIQDEDTSGDGSQPHKKKKNDNLDLSLDHDLNAAHSLFSTEWITAPPGAGSVSNAVVLARPQGKKRKEENTFKNQQTTPAQPTSSAP
jgi:hypothetical protein